MRQILLNLLGNAVKFTEAGEVLVSAGVETESGSALVLHFEVGDTGIGIAPERQQAIFEAFTQADGSTTRKYGGTGLGLSICARLVDLMGGRIWVESRLGEGSSFHFTMRATRVAGPVPAIEASSTSRLSGHRALIVDDNATCRGILADSCARWEIHTECAVGASMGIYMMREARAAGKPYDLVLLDGRMPETNGFEAAQRVHEDSELNGSALILMLDTSDLPENSGRCRTLGIAKYLVKPTMPSELKEAILAALGLEDRNLEQHRGLSEASPNAAQALAGLRILVAEDHPVNRKLVTRLLEKRSVTPVLASDGNEVLRALESDTFDLILMDVQMPAMDGLQATAAIREREQQKGGHVPILAMTAHAMDRDRERCLEAGMDAYVTKPVSPEELYRAIDDLLSLHRHGD